VDYPQFHLNLDGQKLVFDFVKWVLVGLVAFYTFEGFSFFFAKSSNFCVDYPQCFTSILMDKNLGLIL
jgi:hypothetical protein